MRTNIRTIWVISICFVVILAGVIGLFYWRGSQMTASDYQLQTLLVFLSKPLNGSTVNVGDTVPVSAEAVGNEAIGSLEFWVDGKLIDITNSANPELTRLNGIWNWTPDKEGLFTLSARGKDTRGQVILSNTAQITVVKSGSVELQFVPKEGETLAGLAEKLDLDDGMVTGMNPGVGLKDPLPGNSPVSLPAPDEKSLPAGYIFGTAGKQNIGSFYQLDLVPTPGTPDPDGDKNVPPSAPKISWELTVGCKIRVTVTSTSDNADLFTLSILRPASNKAEVAMMYGSMLSGNSFEYIEPNAYGKYQVSAEASNQKGTAASDPVTIHIAESVCSQFTKQAADVKVLTRKNITRLYCYATFDDLYAVHIPFSQDSYITPMSSYGLEEWGMKVFPYAELMARYGYDITPHIPSIYPKGSGLSHIEFECWDWDNAFSLGTVSGDFTDAQLKTVIMLSNPQYDVVGIFGAYPVENANHIQISDPYNFKSTGNPDECGKHGPSSEYQNCVNMIKAGMAAYVWDYHKQSCFPGTEAFCQYVDIDGFRIYRHYKTGEPTQFAYGIAGKELVTAGFTQWPMDPPCNDSWIMCKIKNQPCYTVRAYKGSIESRDSNEVCLKDKAATTGTVTTNFTPTTLGVGGEYTFKNKGANSGEGSNVDYKIGASQDGHITVGHAYSIYEGSTFLFFTLNEPERDSRDYFGYARFGNLDEIMGKPIQSAFLKFNMVKTKSIFDGYSNNWEACARYLAISEGPIFMNLMPGPPKIKKIADLPLVFTPDEIRVDVTDVVKGWSQDQENYGFALSGVCGPSVLVQSYKECFTVYNNFKLEVTYFPNP